MIIRFESKSNIFTAVVCVLCRSNFLGGVVYVSWIMLVVCMGCGCRVKKQMWSQWNVGMHACMLGCLVRIKALRDVVGARNGHA